jgi:hypothetical protein
VSWGKKCQIAIGNFDEVIRRATYFLIIFLDFDEVIFHKAGFQLIPRMTKFDLIHFQSLDGGCGRRGDQPAVDHSGQRPPLRHLHLLGVGHSQPVLETSHHRWYQTRIKLELIFN